MESIYLIGKSASKYLCRSDSNNLRIFCYFILFCRILVILVKSTVVFWGTKWLGIMVPVVSAMKEKPLNKKNDRCFPSLRLWVRPTARSI